MDYYFVPVKLILPCSSSWALNHPCEHHHLVHVRTDLSIVTTALRNIIICRTDTNPDMRNYIVEKKIISQALKTTL